MPQRDFASYYEEALAKRGLTGPGVSPGGNPVSPKPAPFHSLRASGPTAAPPATLGSQDPLSWIIDMLSRPMYGSSQVASNIADADVARIKRQQAGQNPVGAAVQEGGEILGNTLFGPNSWLAAVINPTNDPNHKKSFSKVIEETTDKYGTLDPNYVNRVDNVAPAVKGPLGLVGDIGLDPTTYIPGALIAKVVGVPLKVAAKGAKYAGYNAEGRALLRQGIDPAKAGGGLTPTESVKVSQTVADAQASTPQVKPNPFKGETPTTVPTPAPVDIQTLLNPLGKAAVATAAPVIDLAAKVGESVRAAKNRIDWGFGIDKVTNDTFDNTFAAMTADRARALREAVPPTSTQFDPLRAESKLLPQKPIIAPGKASEAPVVEAPTFSPPIHGARKRVLTPQGEADKILNGRPHVGTDIVGATRDRQYLTDRIREVNEGTATPEQVAWVSKMREEARIRLGQAEPKPMTVNLASKVVGNVAKATSVGEQIRNLDAIPQALRAQKEVELLTPLLEGQTIGRRKFVPGIFEALVKRNSEGTATEPMKRALLSHRRKALEVAKTIDSKVKTGAPVNLAARQTISAEDRIRQIEDTANQAYKGPVTLDMMHALDEKLAALPVKGQAETLSKWSTGPETPKDIQRLLEAESRQVPDLASMDPKQAAAITAKADKMGLTVDEYMAQVSGETMSEYDRAILRAIRMSAAREIARAADEQQAALAIRNAMSLNDRLIIDAGPLVTHTDLHTLMQASPYVDSVNKYLADLENQVGKNMPTRGGVVSGKQEWVGGEWVRTGIFDTENSDLLRDTWDYYLSPKGSLAQEYGRRKIQIPLEGGATVSMTLKALRDRIAWLSDVKNGVAHLQEDGTVSSAIQREMTPQDGLLLKAVGDMFYADVQAGKVSSKAIEAAQISHALEALRWSTEHEYEKVQRALGDFAADAVRSNLGNNPTMTVNHFETLRKAMSPGFTADDLEAVLRAKKNYVSGQHVLEPFFEEMGHLPEYNQYVKHRALVRGKNGITEADQLRLWPREEAPITVEGAPESGTPLTPPPSAPEPKPQPLPGQAPTPPEAVPPGVDPGLAAEIADTPSAIIPEPVGKEQLLANIDRLTSIVDDTEELSWGQQVIEQALGVFKRDMLAPESLPTVTKTGVRLSGLDWNKVGWRNKVWNIHNQREFMTKIYGLAQKRAPLLLRREMSNAVEFKDLMGARRWAMEEQIAADALQIQDEFLSSIGVKQVLGTKEAESVPLSLGDVLRAFSDNSEAVFGPDATAMRQAILFSRNANWTNIGEAVRLHLQGAPREDVVAQLLNDRKLGVRGELKSPEGADLGTMDNPLTRTVFGPYQLNPKEDVLARWQTVFPGATFRANQKGKGAFLEIPGRDAADALANLIEASTKQLGAVAVNNGWRYGHRVAKEAVQVSDSVMRHLTELAADPEKVAEYVRSLASIRKATEEAVKGEGMYPEAARAGEEIVTAQADPVVVQAAKDQVNHVAAERTGGMAGRAESILRANDTGARVVSDAVMQDEQAGLVALMNEREIVEPLDLLKEHGTLDKVPVEQQGHVVEAMQIYANHLDDIKVYENEYLNTLGKFFDGVNKKFNASAGMKNLWQSVHAGGVFANSYLAQVSNDIDKMSKRFTQDELKQAYEGIVAGTRAVGAPKILAAQDELSNHLNVLWSTGEKSVLGNVFLNTEPNVEYLNGMFRKYFPKDGKNDVPQFDMDKARNLAKKNGTSLGDELAAQWRDWKVNDPADFVLRATSAAIHTAERRAVVSVFNKHVADWGYASTTPKPGWMKPAIARNSEFATFIDQNKYYPKELLAELHHADIFVSTSRQIPGEFGDFMRRSYLPLLNAWKRGMTILRPGHHIRTQIGDSLMTWTVRGNWGSLAAGKDAARVLGVTNDYQGVDFVNMLNSFAEAGPIKPVTEIPHFDDVLFTGNIGGKKVEVTAGMVSDAIHRNGLKPTYHLGEGLYENDEMRGMAARAASFVSLENTAVGKFAGNFSQARDHWTRAQHFIQVLRQEMSGNRLVNKQFSGVKSMDDLMARAAAEVKKYHPDASMLTPFEARYMRPLVPFYSWMAKIMPAFADSMVRNVGRVNALPKASYELAVTMGVNPDTISDPFPGDQMFPSYFTEKVYGPQFIDPNGGYFGINPGTPIVDQLNTLLGSSNIGGNLASNITPALRLPFELISGTSVSGVPINDTSDYIDSQIPGVNYLATTTGVSPTGTLTGAGLGDANPSPLDFQYQVGQGNKQPLIDQQKGGLSGDAITGLLNYLTGFGITGMSRPNQIHTGEMEARNAARG